MKIVDKTSKLFRKHDPRPQLENIPWYILKGANIRLGVAKIY